MEMLTVSDRRVGRRAVFVECQVVREDKFKLLGDRAIDLSTDGMLVLSSAHVLKGQEVLVSLRVPGTGRWLDVAATVARVVRGRRHGDRGRALGLRFEPLDTASSRMLRWALRRVPPTLPVRPPRIDYAATASLIALT
jgi:hypothetical protein